MSYKNTEIIMYQSQDGVTKIDVRMEGETVWLTQTQMADLFQTSKQNISLHINNAFKEGEITPAATVKEYLTVQNEGGRSGKGRTRNSWLMKRSAVTKVKS